VAKGFGRAPDLEGFDATIAMFKKYAAVADEAADDAMRGFVEKIFQRSQELVPVRDPNLYGPRDIPGGSLKVSGTATKVGTGVYNISYGTFTFGGEVVMHGEGTVYRSAWYAVYVHENPDFHHPHGEYKYLEKAVQQVYPEMVAGMGRAFMDGLSKVGGSIFHTEYGAFGGGRFIHGSELSDRV